MENHSYEKHRPKVQPIRARLTLTGRVEQVVCCVFLPACDRIVAKGCVKMKLNHDCMRDILLVVERDLCYFELDNGYIGYTNISLKALCEALPDYSKAEIAYSIEILDQAGFLSVSFARYMGGIQDCHITKLTYAGHEFLERIRDARNWSKTKTALSAIRNYSLDAIQAIAQGMTSGAISAYLETHP